MNRKFQLLQRRFGQERPGLQLVGVEDAAIPVSDLRSDVLAQERRELSITDEFSLLFVEAGIDNAEDIASYLGLEPVHVIEAAATQVSESNLRRRSGSQQLVLTSLGAEVVRNASTVRPTFRNLPVKFDRLIWKPADYLSSSLIPRRRADELGFTLLPAERKSRIGLDDFSPADLNALLRIGNLKNLQVLEIHKVSTRKNVYLPVLLLVYADKSGGEIEFIVCIDDEISESHGLALDQNEIVASLRMSVSDPRPRPQLEEALESQRVAVAPPGTLVGLIEDESAENPEVARGLVRGVSSFEHRDLLLEALDTARSRILIFSSVIRSAVVNSDFLTRLEGRLRKGVKVTIEHRSATKELASDEEAMDRLGSLASKYSNFDLKLVENDDSDSLIFDDTLVSTRFEWLSFRGNSERVYRVEEGTLVNVPEYVNRQYSERSGRVAN